MEVFEPQSGQLYDNEVDDDIPFDVDPWMHDGISGGLEADEVDARGAESDEEDSIGESKAGFDAASDSSFPRLMTGADLAEKQASATHHHPSMYRTGMTVQHDEYGDGVIESISGQNMKKTATVDFPELGKKKFRLAFTKLEIVDQN